MKWIICAWTTERRMNDDTTKKHQTTTRKRWAGMHEPEITSTPQSNDYFILTSFFRASQHKKRKISIIACLYFPLISFVILLSPSPLLPVCCSHHQHTSDEKSIVWFSGTCEQKKQSIVSFLPSSHTFAQHPFWPAAFFFFFFGHILVTLFPML